MEGHRDLHATIDTHASVDPPSESDKCETNIPYQDYGLVCCRKCYRRRYITPPPTICTTLAGYGIAERDGERRESGRRACLRIGTACDTVRSGTCMRYDAGPDGVRAYGSGRRACYGSGRRATRCGPGRRANGRDGVRYAVRLRSARANGAVRNHVRA